MNFLEFSYPKQVADIKRQKSSLICDANLVAPTEEEFNEHKKNQIV